MSDSSDNEEIFGNDDLEDEVETEKREREENNDPMPSYTKSAEFKGFLRK